MKKFGAFICSIILIPTLCFSILLLSMENFMSQENIKKIFQEVKLSSITEETFDEESQIYKSLEKWGISKEDVQKVIDSKIVKEVASDITNNIIDYYVRDNEKAEILTEEQLEKLLKETIVTFSDLAKIEVTDEMEQEIYNLAEPELKKIQTQFPTVKNLEQESPETIQVLKVTKIIFGKEVKLILLVLFAVSFLGIYLLRKKDKAYLFWYGVNTLISSTFLFVAFFGMKLIVNMEITEKELEEIRIILNEFISKGFVYSSILLVLSILLFVAHSFVKKDKPATLEKVEEN